MTEDNLLAEGAWSVGGLSLGVSMVSNGIMGVLFSPFEAASIQAIVSNTDPDTKIYTLETVSSLHPFFQFISHAIEPALRAFPISFSRWFVSQIVEDDGSDKEINLSVAATVALFAAQALVQCLPLVITIPMDTVRRRLFSQNLVARDTKGAVSILSSQAAIASASNLDPAKQKEEYMKSGPRDVSMGSGESFNIEGPNRAVFNQDVQPMRAGVRVAISGRRYVNAVDCVWRMIREEGLLSLYRGWGIQVALSLVSYLGLVLSHMGAVTADELDDDEEF